MKIAGRDTVVMVNRGWAYSPDAASSTNAHWKEKDSLHVAGYAETFAGKERARAPNGAHRVHALDRDAIQSMVGLPVAPYVLVQTSDSVAHADSVPVRLSIPCSTRGRTRATRSSGSASRSSPSSAAWRSHAVRR